MKKILLSLITLIYTLWGFGQNYKWFTADTNLSSSMINQIYQDRNGIIWIATEYGLNKYDGAKFTIYKNEPGNPLSLSNSSINCVFQDSKGRIWIGTLSGLNLYDPERNTFTSIPLDEGNYKINQGNISSIIERKDGTILVGVMGFGGIYQIKTDKDNKVSAVRHSLTSQEGSIVSVLYEDRKGNLWITYVGKGLYRLSPNGKLRMYFLGSKNNTKTQLSCMCEDAQGNLFAGTLASGLYKFNPALNQFQPINYPRNPYLYVRHLHVFRPHSLLIGTDGEGLKLYDDRTQTITEFPLSISAFSTTNSKIHSILKDNRGNLWMGFYQKGVILFPAIKNNFHYLGYLSPSGTPIGSSCIMSVLKTSSGTLLIGGDNDGLYAITDRTSKKAQHFPHTDSPSSVPSTIMTMFEDSRQQVWLGSYLGGMAQLNPKTGECQYTNNLNDETGKPVQSVYGFAEDKRHNLWIGSNGAGLFRMNMDTRKITPCNNLGGDDNRLGNKWVNALLYTEDDKLYIGTFSGLYCLNLRTMKYDNSIASLPQLQNKVVYTFHQDSHKQIWIGTYTGLFCLNPTTKKMKTYTVKDGLPNDVIVSIQEDKAHNLWIATTHGLTCFNPDKQQFINYYADDGIQGNEFSKNTAYTNNDGEMFFGGTNGVTCFYPDKIQNSKNKPEIRITGFYVHGNEVTADTKSGFYSIMDKGVLHADKFRLAATDNSFSIEFSAMEFYNPERINYSYRIGKNPWINLTPGSNRLSFSDLAPGTYHFEVRSRDYDTFSDIKKFTVVVRPAWYASWLAILLYAMAVVAGFYYAARRVKQRYQYQKQMQQHIHAEQLNEAKLQFFINISHEIRTPMSLIISPLQKLMASDNDADRQKDYSLIMRNAKRILRLINQLMDVRKIDKGQMKLHFQETQINDFVRDICKTFEYQMHQKHIDFIFEEDMKDVNAWVDPENFDKIILNLLSNALKFTPENGKIQVILNTGTDSTATDAMQHYLEISVKDSGIGIDPNKMQHIFERFYQIRNGINNATVGTGVGLHLIHSLVKLHHGTITVKNNEGEPGCTFTLRFPLGKEHLNQEETEMSAEVVNKTNQTIGNAYTDGSEVIEKDDKKQSKTKLRVLLVEDDEEIRHYISRELSDYCHITECTNGQEAWDKIRQKTADLVISDIMMPVMDGLTLCKKIKQNIHTNTVPVILLTAKTREEEQMEGLDTGADAYITKPFNIEYLRKSMENLIKNRELLRNCYKGNQETKVDISALKEESPDEKLMRRIMKVINDNLSNPELSVDMIAKEVGISRVHLYRKLKELTNQSTRDFLRNIRLKHAAELLKGEGGNVTRIAQLTGFTSIAVFSHSFKELYGVPPTEYAAQFSREKRDDTEQTEEDTNK